MERPVRFLRVLRRLAALLVTALALVGAVRLVAPAAAPADEEPSGVRRQLAFVREALDRGAAERAQEHFPEGYFLSHALYGLAWVELGHRSGDRVTALREARWALVKLDSPAGRAPFDDDLAPAYGVFYVGWTTWLRGGVLSLQPAGQRDAREVQRFAKDAADLAAAFDASASPYLATYHDLAWPCDTTVGAAALRLHDHLLTPRYEATIARWLKLVRERLDPRTGLMPHQARVDTGEPVEGARGTCQGVIHRFLPEIDPAFARDQYLVFRRLFLVSPLGMGPAIREYPPGVRGEGDVDSGPLVLGTSFAATVVTLGAAQVQGDAPLAAALTNYAEFMGAPIDTPRTKRYLFGAIPIGDAFLAWSKTARPWTREAPPAPAPSISWQWRAPLLGILLLIAAAPWTPALVQFVRMRRRAAGSRS